MAIAAPPRPPAQDDPEALIPEARERQRRRQLLALAAVATAVALGLGVYGAATGGGPLGTVQGSLGLGGTPKICRSSQVKTEPLFKGFGMPASVGGLVLTNTTGSACSLPSGAPRVNLFWHGQRLAVRQIHVTHFIHMTGVPATPVSYVLGPKHSCAAAQAARVPCPASRGALIYFDWRNWCGPPKVSLPLVDQTAHVAAAGLATRRPMIFRFQFGNALFVTMRGYSRPQCTHPGAPSTITATQPLRYPS
jgi:hypothetical protein